MEKKEISMEYLMNEIVPESNFGPKAVIIMCQRAVEIGKNFNINVGDESYEVPIKSIEDYLEPDVQPEEVELPAFVPPDAQPSVTEKDPVMESPPDSPSKPKSKTTKKK